MSVPLRDNFISLSAKARGTVPCRLNDQEREFLNKEFRHNGAKSLRWSDLDPEGKTYLTAWYILGLAEPPSRHEPLPTEAYAALSELSASAGRYNKTRRFLRQRFELGLPANQVRQVRSRKQRHQLA